MRKGGEARGNNKQRASRKHYLLTTYESDEGPGTCRCYRCGDLLDYWLLTVDRIHPGCHGGGYHRWNIRPACKGCNSSTGARLRARVVPSEQKGGRTVKINEIVSQMDPPRYTRSQAGELVGRTVDTLKRWKRDGTYVPSDKQMFGKTQVDLYTDADIVNMRRIVKGQRQLRHTA